MTQQLERAFAEAAKLPDEAQVGFAEWILAELQSELRWDRLFSESPDVLAMLAQEGIDEYEAGETEELDPEQI